MERGAGHTGPFGASTTILETEGQSRQNRDCPSNI